MQKQAYLSRQPAHSEDGPSFIGYPVALPYREEFSTLHFHEQFEIGICHEGESIFLIENEHYYVCAGDAIFIPPNVHHFSRSINENAPCLCEFVYVKEQRVRELLAQSCREGELAERIFSRTARSIPPILHPSQDPKATSALRDMVALCTIDRPYLDALLPLKLSSFLLLAYSDSLMETTAPQSAPKIIQKGDELISALAEYLATHYDRNDSVRELSQMCHLSESQLTRRFLKIFGTSPIAYKNQIRTHVARELLFHTDLSLEEISLRLGYTSYTDFYRMFKKTFSLSPGEYRKTKTR